MSKKQKQMFGISIVVVIAAALILFPLLQDIGLGSDLKATDPKKYEMVMERYKQAKKMLDKNSKDAEGLTRLGVVYEEFGDDDAAIAKYQEVIALDKINIMAWTNLAAMYKKMGKYEDAKNAYMQAIEIFPKDTQSYTNLADLYMNYNGGEIDKVLAILEQGIKETGDAALNNVRDELKKKWNK